MIWSNTQLYIYTTKLIHFINTSVVVAVEVVVVVVVIATFLFVLFSCFHTKKTRFRDTFIHICKDQIQEKWKDNEEKSKSDDNNNDDDDRDHELL